MSRQDTEHPTNRSGPSNRDALSLESVRSDPGTANGLADQTSSIVEPERASALEIMVGIPAYNEAHSIANVVADAKRYADTILVVDDGSDDETSERARAAGAKVVRHEHNQGYGATLQTIFHHAYVTDVDRLVILDGDGQHDPSDIPKLLDAQRTSGAEIVVGSRFVAGSGSRIPAYRRVGLAVVNFLANAGLRLRYSSPGVSDTQSGFRAYRREVIETIVESDDVGYGMDASLGLLFHAAREGYDIEEVATTINYDVEGASTHNPVLHGLTLVKAIFLEIIPARALRIGGVLLAVVAAVGLLRYSGGTVAQTAAFVVVGAIAVAGLLLSTASSRIGSTDR